MELPGQISTEIDRQRAGTKDALSSGAERPQLSAPAGLPQTLLGQACDGRRSLFRDREHRADIDLAQHVRVLACVGSGSVKEVCVPDDWQ